MNSQSNLELYASSNVGQVRKNNEDNFLVANLVNENFWNASETSNKIIKLQSDNPVLLAVADGLGGALAGEVASQLTVDTVRRQLKAIENNAEFDQYPFYEKFRLAVELANKIIITTGREDVQYTGMGSTFTGISVHGNTAYTAQVGDSRCYLIRDKEIIQITKDQSLVAQLLETGHITEEEAERHPLKNVILQALGGQNTVNVAISKFLLETDDILLVCSDGLTTMLKNHEILSLINNNADLKTATDALINLANERGGYDNITIILAKINHLPSEDKQKLYVEVLARDQTLPIDLELLEVSESETKEIDIRAIHIEETEKVSITQVINIQQIIDFQPTPVSVTLPASQILPQVLPQVRVLQEQKISLSPRWKKVLSKLWQNILGKVLGPTWQKKFLF